MSSLPTPTWTRMMYSSRAVVDSHSQKRMVASASNGTGGSISIESRSEHRPVFGFGKAGESGGSDQPAFTGNWLLLKIADLLCRRLSVVELSLLPAPRIMFWLSGSVSGTSDIAQKFHRAQWFKSSGCLMKNVTPPPEYC